MANLIRRREQSRGQIPARTMERGYDPFRTLRDLALWDPFRDMGLLGGQEGLGVFAPDFEVRETKDAYVFRADLPGVKEDDLDLSITGNQLRVSGRREEEREEEGDRYYVRERLYGDFSRTFGLPEGADADQVRAEFKNGVLAVTVPKKLEVQPKRVQIGSRDKGAKS